MSIDELKIKDEMIKKLETSIIELVNKKEPSLIKIVKKRLSIPRALKKKVWITYIGNVSQTICPLCEINIISDSNFHCGHVISEYNGGDLSIENLRAICSECNTSMGTTHMKEYTETYYPKSKMLLTFNEQYDCSKTFKKILIKYDLDRQPNDISNYKIEFPFIIDGKHKAHFVIDDHKSIWFNARDTATLLDYKDQADAIKTLVNISNKTKFEMLKNFTLIKRDPRMIYINENGLKQLLSSSKQLNAEVFSNWMNNRGLPSIYLTIHNDQKEIYNKELNVLMKQLNNDTLINRSTNGILYFVDYTTDIKPLYKMGKTNNEKKIQKICDTRIYHKRNVVIIEKFNNVSQLENILIELLKKYRHKEKKNIYSCSLDQLKKRVELSMKLITDINEDDEIHSGGTELYEQIKELKQKINKLDKLIMENKEKIES